MINIISYLMILTLLGGLFDLDSKNNRISELEKMMNDSHFWDDKEYSNKIIDELNRLKDVVNPVNELLNRVNSNIDTLDLIGSEEDELYSLLMDEYDNDYNDYSKIEIQTYLSGEYDSNNCILEIHAGAGGTEACDWANMLLRMYTRYFDRCGYKYQLMDKQNGEEVGIKSIMLKVVGKNAYGYLKNERGVHRLVRISPFDSNKRRHTSFASVEVTPEIDKDVNVEINDNDLKIDIYRSSGPGGQGVNTTDSAVRVTHIPTGIVVTCQNERSQIQNKEHCMEILRSKLYALELEKKNSEIDSLKGGQMSIAFGSGKRSYVMCPYTMVKDNESGYETSNVEKILDGELEELIIKGLRK